VAATTRRRRNRICVGAAGTDVLHQIFPRRCTSKKRGCFSESVLPIKSDMATLFALPRPKRPVDLTRLSDESLAAATRSSSLAGDLLYRRHGAALARFCLSIVHDPHEAADAAHDAWLRALIALAGGADPSNFKAWLFSIARNRCTDSFRVVRTQELDAVADSLVDPRAPVDERHQQQAQLEALWSDLRTLSEAQRSAFVMSEVLGMTSDELATSLRRSSGSCRSLAADARTAVRERQRGRESGCSEIRSQLQTSRGRSRILEAHLEVCGECRLEARRERGRRLIRSLAVVPIPVPLLARLRPPQAWLRALVGPGAALPERFGAAVAASAAAAVIGVGAGTGGASGSRSEAPVAAVHTYAVVAPSRRASATRVVLRPQRKAAAPLVGTRPTKQREAGVPTATAPPPVAPTASLAPPSSASVPRVVRRTDPVHRATDQVAHVVATVQQSARVVAGTPSVAAVVEQVAPSTTGALGFRPLPNF
jgi:RNA polymerase sigma-70 factor (ECF subfamily)